MKRKTVTRWISLLLALAVCLGGIDFGFVAMAAEMEEPEHENARPGTGRGPLSVDGEALNEDNAPLPSVMSAEDSTVSENDSEYTLSGNMIKNPHFVDDMEGWDYNKAGCAANNPPPHDSISNHYWLDPGGYLRQQVKVPYTGFYKFSTQIANSANGTVIGVRSVSGNGLDENVKPQNASSYRTYELKVYAEKDDVLEVYIENSGSSGWVNGCCLSLEYHPGYMLKNDVNIVADASFENKYKWTLTEDVTFIKDEGATLPEKESSLGQSLYIPLTGPYKAKFELEDAKDAKVTFAGVDETVSGNSVVEFGLNGDITLSACDLIDFEVIGEAEVKSIEVRFNTDEFPNDPPVASEVKIEGVPVTGKVLNLSYEYSDADEHEEGETQVQWYMADDQNGTNKEPIEGATSSSFYISEAYEGKHLTVEVIPEDYYGKAGDSVESAYTESIALNLVKNGDFEAWNKSWNGDLQTWTWAADAHEGQVRARIYPEADVYQTIVVPESGYYDLSFYVAFVAPQPKKKAEAGIRIADKPIEKIEFDSPVFDGWNLAGKYGKTELNDILLEEGSIVQVYFKGTEPGVRDYQLDDVILKRNKEKDEKVPAFTNITGFETSHNPSKVIVNPVDKSVTLTYRYGTKFEDIALTDMTLSNGAECEEIAIGDKIFAKSNQIEVNVKPSDGSAVKWTIIAQEAKKKVAVTSSNKDLEEIFNWAVAKQEQFVMTDKTGFLNKDENNPVGDSGKDNPYIPSYWAGYYDRTAFYSRDFVHQATGGQIAGLEEENFSMFKAFAEECTESRKWYTVWAINFDGTPHTIDYKSDESFVREVPAQFELVEKAYKQYLWSGDDRYIYDDDLWNFYTKVMTDYITLHDENENGVAQSPATSNIFQGVCTYNERGEALIEAGDAIGSQYQATLAYAGMLEARGEKDKAEEWYEKAAELKAYFNEDWSVLADDREKTPEEKKQLDYYVRGLAGDGKQYTDFGKENSWFMPMKMITEPGERNDKYIDYIIEKLGTGIGDPLQPESPHNIEAYTYIPDMLFLYNRNDEAWKWMQYITSIKDNPHERPTQGTNGDYPEISFTYVAHTIEGMMGVEADAGNRRIATSPRLPDEVEDVTAEYIQIGEYEIELTHNGNEESILTNHHANKPITWEARFYGDYEHIKIGNRVYKAAQKDINGVQVSYASALVQPGESLEAEAGVSKSDSELSSVVADADKIENDEYDQEKWDAFQKALKDAKEILDSSKSTQTEINDAIDALKEAMENLDKIKATKITLNKTKANLSIDDTIELQATVEPVDTTESVTWDTSNRNVASVTADKDGKAIVTAKAVGKADITAKVGNLTATCEVIVSMGDKDALLATIAKAEQLDKAKYTEASWSALETALNAAKAVAEDHRAAQDKIDKANTDLQAAIDNLNIKDVTVNVSSVKFDITSKNITAGDTFKINATVLPSNASNRGLKWSSSNSSVASVQNGEVKALKEGTATIKAESTDGSKKSASCTIKVYNKTKKLTVQANGYTLNKKKLTLQKGKKTTLKAKVATKGALPGVTFKSNKDKIASVSSKGVVKGKKAGTAKITITSKDGKYSQTYTVKVVPKALKADKITSNVKKNTVSVKKGKTYNLAAKLGVTAKGKKADQITSKFTYRSKNSKIAKVNKAGEITGKKKGKTTIVVKNGKAKREIKVTVK